MRRELVVLLTPTVVNAGSAPARRSMMSATSSAAVSYARLMTRAREEYAMYEDYYGFVEKPFSLTPDPKYLYKSESHANAFELLQYAHPPPRGLRRDHRRHRHRQDDAVPGVLEQLDRKTFTALVLNPFLSEEDLLRLILQDFGVVSRDEIKRGRLAGVSKQELIETLNDFLLSLLPLRRAARCSSSTRRRTCRCRCSSRSASCRISRPTRRSCCRSSWSGSSNLQDAAAHAGAAPARSARVDPLRAEAADGEETSAYVAHRLTIAGGGAAVSFTPKALQRVHRFTGGIPRLINLRLRPRAARGLLGRAPTGHAGHGALGRRQPRPRGRRAPSMMRLAANAGGAGSSDACTCYVPRACGATCSRRATCSCGDVRRAQPRATCARATVAA